MYPNFIVNNETNQLRQELLRFQSEAKTVMSMTISEFMKENKMLRRDIEKLKVRDAKDETKRPSESTVTVEEVVEVVAAPLITLREPEPPQIELIVTAPPPTPETGSLESESILAIETANASS